MSNLTDDLTFKFVFSHKYILEDLINSFFAYLNINEQIEAIDISPQKYLIAGTKKIKAYYCDLLVTLKSGNILILEMYKNNFTKREYKKSLSYMCRLYSSELKVKDYKYEEIKKVICLNFINSSFKSNNKLINTYNFRPKFTEKVLDNGDLEMYLIRLDMIPKIRYNVYNDKRLIKWLRFIKAKNIKEMELIGKGDVIMENTLRFVKEWNRENGQKNFQRYAEEYIYYGIEAGIKKELNTRLQKELNVRLKQEREKDKETLALKLLTTNLTLSQIADVTGLTIKQIKSLQNK